MLITFSWTFSHLLLKCSLPFLILWMVYWLVHFLSKECRASKKCLRGIVKALSHLWDACTEISSSDRKRPTSHFESVVCSWLPAQCSRVSSLPCNASRGHWAAPQRIAPTFRCSPSTWSAQNCAALLFDQTQLVFGIKWRVMPLYQPARLWTSTCRDF